MTRTLFPIKCRRCRVPLTGPANLQPYDMVHCPRCGDSGRLNDVVEKAAKLLKEDIEREFTNTLKRRGFKLR